MPATHCPISHQADRLSLSHSMQTASAARVAALHLLFFDPKRCRWGTNITQNANLKEHSSSSPAQPLWILRLEPRACAIKASGWRSWWPPPVCPATAPRHWPTAAAPQGQGLETSGDSPRIPQTFAMGQRPTGFTLMFQANRRAVHYVSPNFWYVF